MMWRVLAFIVALAVSAMAHPHVFADVNVVAEFGPGGFTGIKNHWVYDELYSAAMAASMGYDGKAFSKEANEKLKAAILGPLQESNYYNYVQIEADFLKAEGVKNFKATMKDGKLVLDFTVKFTVPVTADYTMLVIVVSDPTNYIQMTTDMENADVNAPDGLDIEFFADGLNGLTLFRAFRSDIQGLFLRFKK
jgi:ABC-type uncharacterized transport system substrate-binding protein